MKGQFFYIIDEQWAQPEDSTPLWTTKKKLISKGNLLFLKNEIFWSSLLYYTEAEKKEEEVKFLSTHRDFLLFFCFFIINSWYIKAWLVVWLSFRWWFFRMKWHVVWQFEFIKIFVASSVLCTDLEKGILYFEGISCFLIKCC